MIPHKVSVTTVLLLTCGEPAVSWRRCGPGSPYYRSAHLGWTSRYMIFKFLTTGNAFYFRYQYRQCCLFGYIYLDFSPTSE
jgi:hypothetical protein